MQSILVVGIDVSKRKLDACFFNGETFISKVYESSPEGLKMLMKDAKEEQLKSSEEGRGNIYFAMESTGSYHVKCALALTQEGYTVYVLNPLIIKKYKEENLTRASTDKGSARAIATYVYNAFSNPFSEKDSLSRFKFVPRSDDTEALKLMVKAIEDLFKDRTRATNRMEALKQYPKEYNKIPLKSLKKMVRKIDKEIKSIEKEIMKIIEEHGYKEQYKRLTSIPGVGERTAISLIAYFNEFETFESPKEVVSYVGLTPSIDESGSSVKKKGYKISKMGNPYLRQMLFMASLSASRYNNQCNTLYERLLSEGKDKKVILIAVASKLIRQAFAIVKFEREYNPLYGIKEGETTTQACDIRNTKNNKKENEKIRWVNGIPEDYFNVKDTGKPLITMGY